jgi:hypothetical protein
MFQRELQAGACVARARTTNVPRAKEEALPI